MNNIYPIKLDLNDLDLITFLAPLAEDDDLVPLFSFLERVTNIYRYSGLPLSEFEFYLTQDEFDALDRFYTSVIEGDVYYSVLSLRKQLHDIAPELQESKA